MIEIQLGSRFQGRLYFTPDAYSLWRWADEGTVLTTEAGDTIAFAQEVREILGHLADDGLPPLGAVALLLAAASSAWNPKLEQQITERAADVGGSGLRSSLGGFHTELMGGLLQVHGLPTKLRSSTAAKCELARLVFAGSPHRTSTLEAEALLRALDEGQNWGSEVLRWPDDPIKPPLDRFLEDLQSLRVGLGRVSAHALELRTLTGLDELVGPAESESLFAPDDVRALISQLLDDPEHSALAGLAREIMAAAHVPRALTAQQDLPMGGVSDITNRGPLDRLLLSELAHDPDVFAARVATGEALYMRRESPPEHPPGRRCMLIDTGIRLWGRPRVFAAAVALAMAATADAQTRVGAYIPSDDDDPLTPVDLSTRDGLITLLAALSHEPHPGIGLRAFLPRALRVGEGERAEPILITHREVSADAEFARGIELGRGQSLLIAAVDRSGAFELGSFSRRGRRVLSSARLSLEDIVPASAPLLQPDAGTADELPVILFQKPFPLLLPHNVVLAMARHHPDHGVVSCSKDGRLMHWRPARQEGAVQLTAGLTRGRVHCMELDVTGTVRVLQSGRGSNRLLLTCGDLTTGLVTFHDLPVANSNPHGAFSRGMTLFISSPGIIEAFDLNTGEPLCAPMHGGDTYLGCGLLRSGQNGELWTPGFEGKRLTRRVVAHSVEQGGTSRCRHAWRGDADGRHFLLLDHPPVIQVAGSARTHMKIDLVGGVQLGGVSQDGQRLIVRGTGPQHHALKRYARVDLLTKEAEYDPAHSSHQAWLEPEITARTQSSINLRHRFEGIFVDRRGQLALVSRKGYCMHIVLDSDPSRLLLVRRPPEEAIDATVLQFKDARTPLGGGYKLRQARWPDGSRAFLDSRGLLHLKSSNPGLPEITLVLTELELGGWTSEGRVTARPTYFIGDPVPHSLCEPVEAALFDVGIRHFIAGLA